MNRPATALFLLAAACAGAPPKELARDQDPAIETSEQRAVEAIERQREFQLTLLRLDQGLESYARALADQGNPASDRQVPRIHKMLHDLVVDERTYSSDPKAASQKRRGEHYERLLALAADGSLPDNQGIALAALGFSGLPEVMPVILQGAQLPDPLRRDRAVLGLAVLKDPRTPPGVLIQIVEDASYPEDGRAQAAWALYQLQETNQKQTEIIDYWRRLLLNRRPEVPAAVIATAVRGLGLTRNAADADLVAACTKDQLPRIRMLAAIALARMNATGHWPALVELIGPGESKPNVRLAAQKALVHLAGGQDRGYDVTAWQKLFGELGSAAK
jgi:hypothetical protein